MKRMLFLALARLNRAVLPSLWRTDLQRLTGAQKLLVAWRYYVTCNALDDQRTTARRATLP